MVGPQGQGAEELDSSHVLTPIVSPAVTLDAVRRVTHFLRVPEPEAKAFLPEGWPAICHVRILDQDPCEPADLAEVWLLVIEFEAASWGECAVAAGSLAFVLVETRAQGAMYREPDDQNHEFVVLSVLTDQEPLQQWSRTHDLPGASADITIGVMGSEPNAWYGGAVVESNVTTISGDAAFHTVEPVQLARNDTYRLFLYDPANETMPLQYIHLQSVYADARGGAGQGVATGSVPGLADNVWTAGATWLSMPHPVRLSLHDIQW